MAPLSRLHGEPRFWTQSQCRVPPTHWRCPCFSPTFVPLWGSFIRISPHGDLERLLPSRTSSGQLRRRCCTIPEHYFSKHDRMNSGKCLLAGSSHLRLRFHLHRSVDAELSNHPPPILPLGKHIFSPMLSICSIFVEVVELAVAE